MSPEEPPQRESRSLPSRLLGGPARTAEGIAEEALVRAIESRAVEGALSRVLEGPALEAAVERALRSPAVERSLSRAIDSQMTDRLWEQLLASDEAQKLVERIAEAPEVRAAIASQGVGFIDDLARTVARGAHRLDDVAEDAARRSLRRSVRTGPAGRAGLVSRALALLLDGALLGATFLGASAAIAYIASLFIEGDPAVAATLAAGTGLWIALASAYLLAFWAVAGQTPGMRFLRIRLDAGNGEGIGFRRAVRRLLGGGVSALALGLGFLAVLFDDRRRGWLDRWAGAEVRYTSTDPRPAPWSGERNGENGE